MSALERLYIQVPLNDATCEIRLLRIFGARDREAPIRCHLSTVRLTSPGQYEGLSYHWSGGADNTVRVNDLELNIQGNLFNALKYLRYPVQPRILWVDAICINQASNGPDGEKSKQIALMREIYQGSIRTVAWFGREAVGDGGTQILAGFMQRLLRSKRTLEVERPEVGTGTVGYIPTKEEWTRHRIPHKNEIGYKTLVHLVTRSWTERVWVIQEVAVAREVQIQCGPYTFSMDDVAEAYLFTWTIAIDAARTISTHFKSTWAECVKQKLGQRGTLLSLVMRHWLSYESDPRDKIYALCGLACDAGPDGLNIRFDYHRSAEGVYIDFAQSVLTSYRNLDIFSALSTSKLRDPKVKALPSWVPDWNNQCFMGSTVICRRPDPMPDPGPCRVVFKATKDTVSSPRFIYPRMAMLDFSLLALTSSKWCLTLDGYVLDSIAEMGEPRPVRFTDDGIIRLLINWRNQIAQCSKPDKKRYKRTGEPIVEALYDTMTMGNVRHFLQTPPQDYRAFDKMLLELAERRGIIPPRKKGLAEKLGFNRKKQTQVVPSMLHQSAFFSASGMSVNRRFVRTGTGYLALVPLYSRASDKIALFRGGAMPLVIREKGNGLWHMVGDAYVHGVMMGEVYEDSLCREFTFV